MSRKSIIVIVALSLIKITAWAVNDGLWESENHTGYQVYYTTTDSENLKEYSEFFEAGKKSVSDFFRGDFKNNFQVYIHPNRSSLDNTWRRDWGMPEFRSQCWMVASGVAAKLDLISPKIWDKEACEHDYSDKTKTQQLITHELVHVYHGQLNESPDFSDVSGIDWFVEGLATYASGQCDSSRIAEVKSAITENNIPTQLNDFWSGNLRYGLSGTVVMYIDHKYGRKKLSELLQFNNINNILDILQVTELEIISGWNEYISDQ